MVYKVAVLSELWYPQGGGAELATNLYVRKMSSAGLQVNILTNREASVPSISGVSVSYMPFSNNVKPTAPLSFFALRKILSQIATSNDVAYIPGKLIFLAPHLRVVNRSIRIVAHLHDYQLVCPTASLFNFRDEQRCSYIWSNSSCALCAYRYELVEKGRIHGPLGYVETLMWRRVASTNYLTELLESVDCFICVSNAQQRLIIQSLGKLSTTFHKKASVIYNPVDESVGYIPPSFDGSMYLAFFGGDRYLKGFDRVIRLERELRGKNLKFLITGASRRIDCNTNLKVTGKLSYREIQLMFAKIGIVLFLSRLDEPFPYVPAESQLIGRPVLATSIGGLGETIVKPNYTGNVVESEDSLVDNVLRYRALLLENPDVYTREISIISKEFFSKRSSISYDLFFKALLG